MSDIKMVIALLCEHLSQAVNATLQPEHLRLAKFNKSTNNTAIELWKVLYQLISCTPKEIPGEILLNDYDDVTYVKLCFAHLQYLVPEFYALPFDNQASSRELLLAFSWLLATQNVLTVAIDKKISNSISSQEFSDNHIPETIAIDRDNLSPTNIQLNKIIHICGQLSYNVKTISEIVSERLKLTAKAHAASINVFGLPHLSVSEISSIKRFSGHKIDDIERRMNDTRELACVLNIHAKWEARRHIFFDWMITVIEEHKLSQVEVVPSQEYDCELSRIVCLLRHIIKKRLHNLKNVDEILSDSSSRSDHLLRFLRTQSNYSETEACIIKLKQQLEHEEETAKKKTDILTMQLKKMLRLIPHCVKV